MGAAEDGGWKVVSSLVLNTASSSDQIASRRAGAGCTTADEYGPEMREQQPGPLRECDGDFQEMATP
jgi:hypothetical protein